MSYKRNSKSRIARLLLALTLMGGVGQRIINDKTYALQLTQAGASDANVNEFVGVNGLFKANFEVTEDTKLNSDDAKLLHILFNRSYDKLLKNAYNLDQSGFYEQKKEFNKVSTQSLISGIMDGIFSNLAYSGSEGSKTWGGVLVANALVGLPSDSFITSLKLKKMSFQNIVGQNVLNAISMLGEGLKQQLVNQAKGEAEGLSEKIESYISFYDNVCGPNSEEAESYLIFENESGVIKAKITGDKPEDGIFFASTAEIEEEVEVSIDQNGTGYNNVLQSYNTVLNNFASEKKQGCILDFDGDNFYVLQNQNFNVSLAPFIAALKCLKDNGTIEDAIDLYNSLNGSDLGKKSKIKEVYDRLRNTDNTYLKSLSNENGKKVLDLVNSISEAFFENVDIDDDARSLNNFNGNFNTVDGIKLLAASIKPPLGSKMLTLSPEEYAALTEMLETLLAKKLDGEDPKKVNPNKIKGPNSKEDNPNGKKDNPGEKKGLSTGAKVALWITIPAAVLTAAGVALWKTGYGATIINKVKDLMKGNKGTRPDIKFNGQGNKPVVKN